MNRWHVSITNRNARGTFKWGRYRENEAIYFNLTAWNAVMVAIAFAEVNQLVERLKPGGSPNMHIDFFFREDDMDAREGSFKFTNVPTAA
jgi:hypothetical protein